MRRTPRSAFAFAFASAVVVVVVGCAPPASPRGPQVIGLSHEAITLGETLYIAGSGFLTPAEGQSYVVFAGRYEWVDDDGRPVQEEVAPRRLAVLYDGSFETDGDVNGLAVAPGTQLLRWNRFGPYEVPFGGRGTKPGLFRGTVTVINERTVAAAAGAAGAAEVVVEEGVAKEVVLEVKPSIAFTRLEPVVDRDASTNTAITADCGAPALRALPGLAYVFGVSAVGFVPQSYIWQLAGVNGADGFVTFAHEADPAHPDSDVLGDGSRGEVVVMNAIEDGADLNIVTVQVTAVGANGEVVETVLPLDVVRPLQFYYDGNRALAEYYEPVVVNGPIVGGIGSVLTYSESHSESRQQGVSMTVTRSAATSRGTTSTDSWNESLGVSETLSSTDQSSTSTSETTNQQQNYGESWNQSASTQVGLSSTDGTSWGWSLVQGVSQDQYQENVNSMGSATSGLVTTEVGGEASIPALGGVSGKVGSESGVTNEVGSAVTAGARAGSRTDRGSSASANESETRSYGSTTTDGRSQSIGGTWGVSDQSTIARSTSQTEASTESLVYQTGGSEALTEGYTEGVAEAWGQTWQSTSTDTTLLSFSGKVPNGRCAVVYRQTVRHVRTAWVWEHDLCGVRSEVGELFFNEWSWSPNIAIGDDCEGALPPSTQPAAACFVACD